MCVCVCNDESMWDIYTPILYIYIYISADPCPSQGRGGAWDHRSCGTLGTSLCPKHHLRSETLNSTSETMNSRQVCRKPTCAAPPTTPTDEATRSNKSLLNKLTKRKGAWYNTQKDWYWTCAGLLWRGWLPVKRCALGGCKNMNQTIQKNVTSTM